jgi:hypothetical protein
MKRPELSLKTEFFFFVLMAGICLLGLDLKDKLMYSLTLPPLIFLYFYHSSAKTADELTFKNASLSIALSYTKICAIVSSFFMTKYRHVFTVAIGLDLLYLIVSYIKVNLPRKSE